tara:strand:+ start:549 stop:839 length:291 start_codon:yes stop_codon:yes gene_type:complete
MKFSDIKAFTEALDYPHLLSVQDYTWCKDNDSVYWAVRTAEGFDVYACPMPEGNSYQEDYFIANTDTECGYWTTSVFPKNKEILFEDFEEEYEQWM